MSLFRRPKKPMQRRVFSAASDEDNNENNIIVSDSRRNRGDDDDKDEMDVDPPSSKSASSQLKEKIKSDKKVKGTEQKGPVKQKSLLSFGDDEEEGEVFQVKKSSHSKKVMKMINKERRRKKNKDVDKNGDDASTGGGAYQDDQRSRGNENTAYGRSGSSAADGTADVYDDVAGVHSASATSSVKLIVSNTVEKNRDKSYNSNSSIHTEIRTDDFVLVVKKTEQSNLILNGRAALCAGRDDMSSEEEEMDDSAAKQESQHRFSKPDHFRTLLESGAIPDAAMIHEARKKRQKARELGDFVSLEEQKPVDNKKGRLVHDDADDDISDEERVDMSNITGAKEREERLEKFYSVQRDYSGDESDPDMHEWENQQIRKGVTGAQLVSAQQESILYSQYLIKSGPDDVSSSILSTGNLLEQAYAKHSLDKPRQLLKSTQRAENKPTGPRMPEEVFKKMNDRLIQVKELNAKHLSDIERIGRDLKLIKMEELECEQNAPLAASKFRFYQELREYCHDLIECLDEKIPKIVEWERKAISVMSKQSNMLIERRRQDVRDQAKEVTQAGKPAATNMNAATQRDEEDRIRRAAEREGRRTRRRRDREKIDIKNTHMDGMSSDDEIADHEATLYKNQMKQISAEVTLIFEDVTDDFCQLSNILKRFEAWRQRDFESYKDTYFSLCIPKIIGPIMRLALVTWNPLEEHGSELERMDWYNVTMQYGFNETETEEQLLDDPDVRLVPTVIEKIILPKITEIVESCWDPLSSSQTFKLVGLIRKLGRDYPSLKPTSKYTRTLFLAILDKMKSSLDNDVFIPIFPKQLQEAKSSFFQRQFSSALKLFRNFLSWQGILSDSALKDIAISSLLNRYLLMAIRVCAPIDAVTKSHIIVNTLPRVWLQQSKIIDSLEMFILFLQNLWTQLDRKNPINKESIEKMTQIMNSLHISLPTASA